MNITIPQKDLINALDLQDPETLDLLAKKLLAYNFQYCEKQTAQGKIVDTSKLCYRSN